MWSTKGTTHPPGGGEFDSRSRRSRWRDKLAGQTQWETCEIHDAEGFYGDDYGVRCHWFHARANGPSGTYTAGKSAGFYCPDWTPEPEHAGRQLEALTQQLTGEGWEPVDERGIHWWSLRFRRRARAGLMAAPWHILVDCARRWRR